MWRRFFSSPIVFEALRALLWSRRGDSPKTITVIDYLLLVVPVLVNIAFVTLLERKILGYSQLRLGPNKVSWLGVTQPFADAIKLFGKTLTLGSANNFKFFLFSPLLMLFLTLVVWSLFPYARTRLIYTFSLVSMVTFMRFGVYPLILAGWSSNRNYAILGGIRGVAQTISYEIRFALIVLILATYFSRRKLMRLIERNRSFPLGLIAPFILILWLVSGLAETNRTPFDFAEGESELVSGFNIEYGAGGFVLLFIAEYGRILFLRTLTAALFSPLTGVKRIAFLRASIVSIWVWARATLPRYRYDLLMNLAWKRILPLVLGALILAAFLRLIGG